MPTKKDKTEISAIRTPIFDVAKPGTLAPADATTRPVIVTNRTIMHDPMMVKPATDKIRSAREATAVMAPVSLASADETNSKEPTTVISPFYTQDDKGKVPADQPSVKSNVQDEVEKSDVVEAAQPGKPSDAVISPVAPSSSQNIQSIDMPANDPEVTRQDKEAAELEASAKAQDEIDTLIAEKTYFLPINSVELRRTQHVAVFGTLIIILLALAWLNVALDAGFITIPGIAPVTHFFSN